MNPRWLEIRLPESQSLEGYRESYDALHQRSQIGMRDSFYDWILDLAEVQQGHSLLDVAGGNGALARRARTRGAFGFTLDISHDAVRQAGPWSLVGDGHLLPFADDAFERVASIGSLEHYMDPLQGARELARVTRPNGKTCVLLPNLFSLLGNMWTVFRTGHPFVDRQPIQRYAAIGDWQALLESAGMQVLRVEKYESERPRSAADAAWYVCHPKRFARLVLSPIVPLSLANCHVFICRKRS